MAETDHEYWEAVPDDNQHVYRGFLHKLKIAVVLAAVVVAYLFYRALS